MVNIRDADEILNVSFAGDLFSNDSNKIKNEYKELAKLWHPDTCRDKIAEDVFAKITELYNRANKLIKKGIWEKSNQVSIKKENGKTIVLNYDTMFSFELGTCYISKTKVIYLLDTDKERYYKNTLSSIQLIHYKDKKMEDDIGRFLPKLHDNFKSADGKFVIVMEKTEDVYSLKNVYEYFDNRINARHTAWMLSRLYNLACFLKFDGLVHNGININNCFVSPKCHSILLLGGWWYTTKEGEEMLGTSKDIYSIMPVIAKGNRKSDSLTDLESVKLLGRQLLGEVNCRKLNADKSVPKPFIDFLISGSGDNSYEEFSKWDKVLNASYGERKFVNMEIENIYERKGD